VDLSLTPEQQAFRDEVRSWLAANVPGERLPASSTREGLEAHRDWERKLYDAGYAAIHWPRQYGGRDADQLWAAIFQEEYARAEAPERINVLGLALAGPTLIAYGSEQQKHRWLPGILSCDDIWCQGFSEPEAGSDLAGIRTTAQREGDEFVVNGQKIWTSLGRFADWIFALVRTDRDAPKHKAITYLMIDMHSRGIEVRPIVQINGDAGFSEVFFTDVRVPVENVVGEINDGWRVAMTTLGFERGTGLGTHVRFSRDLRHLAELVRAMGLQDDPVVRDRVAKRYVETEVYRHNMYRTLTTLASGKPIGPEASLNKLYWSEMEVGIFEAGMEVLGPYAEVTTESEAASALLGGTSGWGRWQKQYWYSRAACIYAGTSEIQKNIIAELVLGLPKEPRA
jgi:alkylation response protein AidB-like acyl-CoA dehydrogenase